MPEPISLAATLAIVGGSQVLQGVGGFFGQKSQEDFQKDMLKRQQKFTAQEDELSRQIQRQGLDFNKAQFLGDTAQRKANVMQSLMPYQQVQDRRRFLDTGIGTISQR